MRFQLKTRTEFELVGLEPVLGLVWELALELEPVRELELELELA